MLLLPGFEATDEPRPQESRVRIATYARTSAAGSKTSGLFDSHQSARAISQNELN